jgi:hypothetical protein
MFHNFSAFLPQLELTFGNHTYDDVSQASWKQSSQKHEENIRG